MTRIRKTNRSIPEQLPKHMARILYNTLKQETRQSCSEIRAMSGSERSGPNQEGCSQDRLFAAVGTTENSTWRIGLHKRASKNI